MNGHCINCVYYTPYLGDGECRRFPPRYEFTVAGLEGGYALIPKTCEGCGEFKSITDQ